MDNCHPIPGSQLLKFAPKQALEHLFGKHLSRIYKPIYAIANHNEALQTSTVMTAQSNTSV